MMPGSNDTLLRVVRRKARPSPPAPTVIRIDDSAWKRNQRETGNHLSLVQELCAPPVRMSLHESSLEPHLPWLYGQWAPNPD
jgi:hypothetical protein